MAKIDLLSLTSEELIKFTQDLGQPKFRGQQIFQWIHKGVKSFEDMTNLSKDLRESLKEKAYITDIKIEEKFVSKIDGTTKYLFLLEDHNIIEGVVMKYKHGLTACISSQVGCSMGCSFCASTKGGLVRNLMAGEILDQIQTMQLDIGERISNIVLMGSGEPLHNFKEVISFLKIVNDEKGLNIGNRHITLSTCGLVPEIKKLADLQIPINLAISLHAPTDELRTNLMPIGNKYSIEELIDSCRYYLSKNNRRITFEYSLIKGVNDMESHAKQLSLLLKGLLCHVNLIPVNLVDEGNFEKSKNEAVKKFADILMKSGIEATVRREMGSDINAACGQLRNRHVDKA
ncbi:23S rRNA (adenine(2503)-C(2))-methyltransferase RlmN [Alkaliphilus peptidifermentans]|uniref:Probable dual-specificity RNA methyltransferase RlmN n=1 Tax=Alkaliphilus peptidifermentans DSM 18978 TaxID=1120976 RepID=A0A1G5JAX3_9FIRM|nr:23S rRNA (adenine(2503)-C(2))-methyltransferase RlmN [Alkaliphilus peptidifermentans]SCY85344.1 23S rRNA m(2)A-2503 methyltransferase [Alkaliphilus peptidifermentans DSM 18978]